MGDGYDESAQDLAVGDDQEINLFSVDCPTGATSKLIARATAEYQDSDDEDNVPPSSPLVPRMIVIVMMSLKSRNTRRRNQDLLLQLLLLYHRD